LRVTRLRGLAILLLVTLVGAMVIAPVSSTPPSWMSPGKYATYNGTYSMGAIQPGRYLNVSLGFAWHIVGYTASDINVTVSYSVHIRANMTPTGLVHDDNNATGFEIIEVSTSELSTGGSIYLLGIESVHAHTVLWYDDKSPSMYGTGVTIVQRKCVYDTCYAHITGVLDGPVGRYCDAETGVLLGFNFSEVVFYIGGAHMTLPGPLLVVVNSTNVLDINAGAVFVLIILAVAGAVGSGLVCIIVLRRRQRR